MYKDYVDNFYDNYKEDITYKNRLWFIKTSNLGLPLFLQLLLKILMFMSIIKSILTQILLTTSADENILLKSNGSVWGKEIL